MTLIVFHPARKGRGIGSESVDIGVQNDVHEEFVRLVECAVKGKELLCGEPFLRGDETVRKIELLRAGESVEQFFSARHGDIF